MRKTKAFVLFNLFILLFLFLSLWPQAQALSCAGQEQQVKQMEAAAKENLKTEEFVVKSSLETVVVYPDGAQVWRKGQVNVYPETRALTFSGLPGAIRPESVRVAASGSARIKILGVETITEYLEAEQLPEVKKLLDEIAVLETEIAKIKGQEAILDSQEKFLNSFGAALGGQVAKELASGRPDIAGVDKFIDYLGARLQVIQKSRLENSQKAAEKQAKLEAMRKKLKEIMPARSREEKRVKILIEVAQAGKLEVDLSYAVGFARWVPVYTIKALPESGEIELTVAAVVTQKTGENWDNVRLILSTSKPTAGNQPGQLYPWYLDFAQPRMMKALSRDKMETKATLETEEAPTMAYEERAEIVETWAGVNLEVKKTWSLPSDGLERRVPIDTQKLPATFDYLSVPKLQELAFLRSGIKNTLSFPLLPGRADLFISQDFLGSMNLDFVPVNDELKLFFGEDRQLKVKRELMKREKSGPGFLGKNEKINLVYKITLENLRKRLVEVELQDQIPVSQNSRIEVKDIKIVPPPLSRDEKGILTWKIKLEPGQRQEFSLEFTVEYPKDTKIIGI